MSYREYTMATDPVSSPLGRALVKMAHDAQHAAARLVTALEEFLRADSHTPYNVLQDLERRVDVCIVPPRYVLLGVPDAAALLRVDHSARRIDLIEIIDDYGGPGEGAQWQQIIKSASEAL